MPTLDEPLAFALCMVVFFVSLTLHESAHAYTADALGDPTPRALGRLTLNPFKHLHWLGSVVLPLLLFVFAPGTIYGAAKPVPVVPANLRDPTRHGVLVFLAGPLSNVALALVFTGVFVGLRRTIVPQYDETLYDVAYFAIRLNLTLVVLNSLPIPPLDGSRALAYFLPNSIRPWFYRLDPVGFIILIVLMLTGVLAPVFEATVEPVWRWWSALIAEWLVK